MAPDETVAVLGHTVMTPDGKVIGRLIDVLVDATGHPVAAVIDFGGFMGLGARKVAVHWATLHFTPSDHKHAVTLDLTVDQIKAAPEYKESDKPVAVVVKAPKPVRTTAAPVHPGAAPALPPANGPVTPATSSGAATAQTAKPLGQ